jgi:hypothetical protein
MDRAKLVHFDLVRLQDIDETGDGYVETYGYTVRNDFARSYGEGFDDAQDLPATPAEVLVFLESQHPDFHRTVLRDRGFVFGAQAWRLDQGRLTCLPDACGDPSCPAPGAPMEMRH